MDVPDLGSVQRHDSGLSPDELARWRTDGWLLLKNFMPREAIAHAADEFWQEMPQRDAVKASQDLQQTLEDPFAGMKSFPFDGAALCDLTTSTRLADVATALLNDEQIQLYQAQLWAKYGGVARYEQTHHRDYAKNTALVPRTANGGDDFCGCFIYLNDVDFQSGPTALVSRASTAHLPLEPARFSRSENVSLYRDETLAIAPAGSVLLLAGDTFHRATEVAPNLHRIVIKLAFKRASASWVMYYPGLRIGYEPNWSQFVARATDRQVEIVTGPCGRARLNQAREHRYMFTNEREGGPDERSSL